jgi:hypothetical protein
MDKVRARYREFCVADQQEYLIELINDVISFFDQSENPPTATFFLEKHKDGRYHLHGTIGPISMWMAKQYRIRINEILGYDIENKKIFYTKKITNEVGWDRYCNKEQHNDHAPSASDDVPNKEEYNKYKNNTSSMSESEDELFNKISIKLFETTSKRDKTRDS